MSGKQNPQTFSLWRTRGQSVRWVLHGRPFRAAAILAVCAALTLAVIWQWPTLSWAYSKVAESFEPEAPRYEPVDLAFAASTSTVAEANDLRDKLTLTVGATGSLISSKASEGVSPDNLKPAQDALAGAQELLDKSIRFIPLLHDRLDALTTAANSLSAQTAPPAPVVERPPTESGNASGEQSASGNGGGHEGASGGGTGSGGTAGGGTATTSSSLTCNGGTVKVTFTATGSGTVSLSVTGLASGSNSGSGEVIVVVTGPGGSYTASASASGTVAISGHCG